MTTTVDSPKTLLPELGCSQLSNEALTSVTVVDPLSNLILTTARDRSALLSTLSTTKTGESVYWPLVRYCGFGHFVSDAATVLAPTPADATIPGGFFAAIDWSGRARLFNFDSSTPTASFAVSKMGLRTCSLSADGNYLLSGGFDKTIRIWDVPRARELCAFGGDKDIHNGWVNAVAFLPTQNNAAEDGELAFMSAGEDTLLKHFRLQQSDSIGTEKKSSYNQITAHSEAVLALTVSKSGTRVCSGSRDGSAVVFDVSDAAKCNMLARLSVVAPATSVAFSPADENLVAAAAGGNVQLFDLRAPTDSLLGTPDQHLQPRGKRSSVPWATSVVFSNSGNEVLVVYSDGKLVVFSSKGQNLTN